MLETVFTTEFEQGIIPAGFHIHLEGNFITVIGSNGSGKTSLLHALFRKNVGVQIKGKTQICLIPPLINISTTISSSRQTLEQYNIELAKIMGENSGRGRRPSPSELPRLLLNHNDFRIQVQKLNSYLEYLDLPKCEIQGEHNIIFQPPQGSGFSTVIAILAALTDDHIKMILIDEPESHLHPQLQKLLRELLYDASREKQIIVATHSNVFINNKDYTSNYFISRFNEHFYIKRVSSESQLEGISSGEIKLIKALTKSLPSITNNLLTSLNIEKLIYKKSEDISKITQFIQGKSKEINVTIFYEDLLASIKLTKDELAVRRRERIQQTNISYYVLLACLILGVLLVFIGAVLIFVGRLEGGVLTTISSIISSIVSGLVFVFNKQINDIEREDSKEMRTLEKSYDAMGYISCITDVEKRDELIRNLVEKHFFGN